MSKITSNPARSEGDTCNYLFIMRRYTSFLTQFLSLSQTFSDTLENKKLKVTQIQALADELQEEDGEKNNGTCDVDSR